MRGPIGVFDSGFGGLHILRGIVRRNPQYDYMYLGDTARVPYGTRSPRVVYEFTKQAVDFLFKKGCAMIIIACNTASSGALRTLQQEHVPKRWKGKKVLGVLIPAAEEAVVATKNKRVGIIATEGTVRSNTFTREIKKLDPRVHVFQQAAPLLVPVIEAGEQHSKAAALILRSYLEPLKRKRIDTLVLGCTHYGLLLPNIRKLMGAGVAVISEAEVVGRKLRDYLERHPEVRERITQGGRVGFYSTDVTDKFDRLGSTFYGAPVRGKEATLV